jgi:hypothetical protein
MRARSLLPAEAVSTALLVGSSLMTSPTSGVTWRPDPTRNRARQRRDEGARIGNVDFLGDHPSRCNVPKVAPILDRGDGGRHPQ